MTVVYAHGTDDHSKVMFCIVFNSTCDDETTNITKHGERVSSIIPFGLNEFKRLKTKNVGYTTLPYQGRPETPVKKPKYLR